MLIWLGRWGVEKLFSQTGAGCCVSVGRQPPRVGTAGRRRPRKAGSWFKERVVKVVGLLKPLWGHRAVCVNHRKRAIGHQQPQRVAGLRFSVCFSKYRVLHLRREDFNVTMTSTFDKALTVSLLMQGKLRPPE